MQPEERDLASMLDMLKYARRVRNLVAGRSFGEYLSNHEFRHSVERVVEIIGEAASQVSRPFRRAHPEIPWSDITGMRVILVHRYGTVQPRRVWETAREDAPALIAHLEALLPPDAPDPGD